jgi:hypothetical protein
MILSKRFLATDFRVTLDRVTQEISLVKIDPDPGLQADEGPSRTYFTTVAARHYFRLGSFQTSFSMALSAFLRASFAARSVAPFSTGVSRQA